MQQENVGLRQGEQRLELLNFVAAMQVWSLKGIKRDIGLYAVLCVFFSALLGIFVMIQGNFEIFGKISLGAIVLAGLVCAYRLDARFRNARETRTELRQTTDEMRSLGGRVPAEEDISPLKE